MYPCHIKFVVFYFIEKKKKHTKNSFFFFCFIIFVFIFITNAPKLDSNGKMVVKIKRIVGAPTEKTKKNKTNNNIKTGNSRFSKIRSRISAHLLGKWVDGFLDF